MTKLAHSHNRTLKLRHLPPPRTRSEATPEPQQDQSQAVAPDFKSSVGYTLGAAALLTLSLAPQSVQAAELTIPNQNEAEIVELLSGRTERTEIDLLLKRGEDGRLVPAAGEPETIPATRAYAANQHAVEDANSFEKGVEKDIQALKRLDNSKHDLNSAPGIVATTSTGWKSDAHDTKLLKFDPETGETLSYERQLVDYTSRSLVEIEGKYTYVDSARREESLIYQGGPLSTLDFEGQFKVEGGPEVQRTISLRETSSGDFRYRYANEATGLSPR